jgi:hypothetical protein
MSGWVLLRVVERCCGLPGGSQGNSDGGGVKAQCDDEPLTALVTGVVATAEPRLPLFR